MTQQPAGVPEWLSIDLLIIVVSIAIIVLPAWIAP